MLHIFMFGVEPATHGPSGFGLNLGTLLSGIAALVLALGSGLGALVRYRRAAKQIKIQANQHSILTAQEAGEQLMKQYEARLLQKDETITRLNISNDEQRHLYEERLANQQTLINSLLAQILKHYK